MNFNGLCLFLALITMAAAEDNFLCPAPETISPCDCAPADALASEKLTCWGPSISQQVLNTLFSQVRAANNLSQPDDWLTVSSFYMFDTTLDTLDLSPFAKTNFGQFYFFTGDLTTIQGGTESSEESEVEPYRFTVGQLTLDHARLTDPMLSEMFRFLKPENLTLLSLSGNLIEGSSQPGDFIQGLSAFGSLRSITLYRNQIGLFAGGQFRNNSLLTSISLQGNLLTEVGQDAFLFNGPTDKDMGLFISLSDNLLNDASFGGDNGLVGLGRPINLNLRNNQFEFLSDTNFKQILDADERNSVNFFGNSFLCDERMVWLENAPELYKSRVFCVNCANRDTDIFGEVKCAQ